MKTSSSAVEKGALGDLLRDPNWLLGSGFYRSRCWLGYHNRIGNRLRIPPSFLPTTRAKSSSPREEAKVVTDGAEDGIGGVAGAAFEIATAEMTFCLHVADHRLDGGATSELAFDAAEHPALLA